MIVSGNGKNLIAKVRSNNATVLTLTKALVVTPAVGDKVGITLWLWRARLTNVNGSGTGVNYTTKTFKTPHTITIFKSGYETYKSTFSVEKPLDMVVRLRNDPSPGRDEMGNDFR